MNSIFFSAYGLQTRRQVWDECELVKPFVNQLARTASVHVESLSNQTSIDDLLPMSDLRSVNSQAVYQGHTRYGLFNPEAAG